MTNYIDILNSELKEGFIEIPEWEYPLKSDADFNSWFLSKAVCFERDENEASIISTIKIRQNTNNQCFHNSQLVSLQNDDIKYYEGFVYGTKYKMVFHHGFNIIDDKAIDVTDFYNGTLKNSTDDNWHKEKVVLYCGIHIPNEFLDRYSKRYENSDIHNPLIYE